MKKIAFGLILAATPVLADDTTPVTHQYVFKLSDQEAALLEKTLLTSQLPASAIIPLLQNIELQAEKQKPKSSKMP